MSEPLFEIVGACRLCGSRRLVATLSLGSIFISDFVGQGSHLSGDRCPLELMRCQVCGLTQLKHTVSRRRLYEHYWYRSSVSKTVRNDLRQIAHTAEELVKLRAGDCVIDIASNDGTLLRSYCTPDLVTWGCDPAENLADQARAGVSQHHIGLWEAEAFLDWAGAGQKAQVVTAISVLYHADEPVKFVRDVARVLADDGIFVVQVSYWPSLLENVAVDSLAHEHLLQLRFTDVERLLEKAGLVAIDASLGTINCGTLRVTATKKRPATLFGRARVETMTLFERRLAGSDKWFIEKVGEARRLFMDELDLARRRGQKILGLAASTKGNMLLQYYGIGPDLIEAIGDANPSKHGKVCIGSGIPVISLEEMRARKPNLLVPLAWAFLDEFLEQEAEFVARGGRFLVPLPEVRFVP